MQAKTKNNIASWIVGAPIALYFPINTWQFWLIGMLFFEIFYFTTLAFPVFVDRVPRRDGR